MASMGGWIARRAADHRRPAGSRSSRGLARLGAEAYMQEPEYCAEHNIRRMCSLCVLPPDDPCGGATGEVT